MFELSDEFRYIVLFAALFILPKALLRYRIPTGLSAMALGVATTVFLGWFSDSPTINLLASLGITSLFLFAGLEIDYQELKSNANALLKHLAVSVVIIFLTTMGLTYALHLDFRTSMILALGLTTPSTGFILNSLNSFNFTDEQRYWIRSKAIAKEIVALLILFFVLQSNSMEELSISLGTILLMIIILPLLFRFFLKVIAPFSPDSEVTFLILIALLCGVITRQLGTYYLIGAFIVGIVASQFRHFISTEKSDKMLYSVGFFFTFFVPFYFYKAGLTLGSEQISWVGLAYGVIFTSIFLPLRYFDTGLSLRFFLNDYWKDRQQISISLMPTLIFGLVVASILKTRFDVEPNIVIGLVFYTVVSSIIPSVILEKAPPEEYDTAFIKHS